MVDNHSMHTHTAGELRAEHVGQTVTLTGWVSRRRNHGALIFCDIRDREGITQCTFDPDIEGGEPFKVAERVRPEWPLKVTGTVRIRPDKNPHLPTGEVEVLVTHVEVLNRSNTPPFLIEDGIETSEDLRLKYRYLDLRRPEMMNNLRLRSDFTFAMRSALNRHAFMEVETPCLNRSTPEGARDFIVPSRINPGEFYALPQSPQLFKQLLMVSGVERYYQVAKCFRDEDLRADRQPEFTQVDIEMSFVDMDMVIGCMEDVMKEAFAEVGVELPTPLRRLPYAEAMNTYGSDKPDTRFGMHIIDMTDLFTTCGFKVFASAAATEGQSVKCINARGAGSWSRGEIDKLSHVAETFGAKGLAWIAYRGDGKITSPVAKFFSEEEMEAIKARAEVEPGDLLLFAATDTMSANEILGGMRLHMANALGIERTGHDFLWVVDFPMFKYDSEANRYVAEHHPFTMPRACDLDKIDDDPLSVLSYTYDFVMDGYEAGGGGIRIHNPELQMRILKRMGFDEKTAEEQFGWLMEAEAFGAPPMGGFAMGLDRVCMLLAGKESIRDVMAFPKTTSGSDLMTDAPSVVSDTQLSEVGISLR